MTQTARVPDFARLPLPHPIELAPLSRRFVRALGAFVVIWAAAWIAIGIWARHDVQSLRELGTTVVKSGTAVKQTGDALQGLRSIPFIGHDVADIGQQVAAAGIDARRSGRSSRAAVNKLATLIGVAIAIVPTVPMLALYLLAQRLARRAEPL
jgi:hypothetical protein